MYTHIYACTHIYRNTISQALDHTLDVPCDHSFCVCVLKNYDSSTTFSYDC